MSSTTFARGADSAPNEIASRSAPTEHRLSAKKFALHFAETVAAMAVGMVVLHPVWMFVLDTVGVADGRGDVRAVPGTLRPKILAAWPPSAYADVTAGY